MIIKALVAVRSGSTRVENKNTRPFAGSSLLKLKIEQLSRIHSLNGIIVNSDDDYMLDIAKQFGCELVKRDKYFASNSISMSEVYKNMAENANCDIVVYTNCTNPLIKDSTIERAIDCYWGLNGYDSLNSAHLIKEFLFYGGKPINYNPKHQPRSQDLPDYYALNFAINIIERKKMIEYSNIVGLRPWLYSIEESEGIDIDNPLDFTIAEFLYKNCKIT